MYENRLKLTNTCSNIQLLPFSANQIAKKDANQFSNTFIASHMPFSFDGTLYMYIHDSLI